MAIQNRRGNDADFDPSKMLPAELAVSLDEKKMYVAFGAGDVEEIALKKEVKQLSEQIDDLPSEEYVKSIFEQVGTFHELGSTVTEEYVPTNIVLGSYRAASGKTATSSDMGYTEEIPVTSGQILKISFMKESLGDVRDYDSFLYVTAYVDGVVNSSLGVKGVKTSEYVVPEGVTSVVLSSYFNKTGFSDGIIEITTDYGEEQYSYALNRNPIGYFQAKGDMADGTTLTLPENNVKNNTITTFFCNVTTLDKLYIGKVGSSEKPYVCIDGTNILWCTDTGATYTKAHGLTISNTLGVRIETETSTSATKIILTSNGTSVDLVNDLGSAVRWIADSGSTFARSEGSTLTNCVLSFTSKNMYKPIWAFGDSYFSYYNQRWVYYMIQDGYDKNVLLNAFAGETSQQALVSFKNLMEVSKPTYVFWCLGMNDGDSDTVVDADWLSAYEEVAEICDKNNINLILATIPQTPTINHSFKNAIVRESGRRYVDFEKAVVSDVSTGAWYSGMLLSDNVHPDVAGAMALYNRVLADFPEIMIDGNTYSSSNGTTDTDELVQEVIAKLPVYGGETA